MNKFSQLIIHSLPLIGGIILSNLLWNFPWLLLGIYGIVAAALIALGKDKKIESFIFLYGIVAGFAIEAIGTRSGGYQTFVTPQLFGIPYWLVIVWGYGFVLMKRISLIIAAGCPWTKKN